MILANVRTALATQISNATGLSDNTGYVPDQINPPCFVLVPGKPFTTYNATLQGLDYLGADLNPASPTLINMIVLILVTSAPDAIDWQANLESYLGFGTIENGQNSVPWAIEQNNTLGGAVEWCVPTAISQYGLVDYAGQTYAGAHLNVQISAR
jgi:hypothetical protein